MRVYSKAGVKPKLSPEQMRDVIELVEARIDTEDRIKKAEQRIKKIEEEIVFLKDRKAALSNTQIGKLFGVSHNVVRDILLGNYRWSQVDAGHENENVTKIK